jgi:two-component system nitrate/nitrite response regulator NarL
VALPKAGPPIGLNPGAAAAPQGTVRLMGAPPAGGRREEIRVLLVDDHSLFRAGLSALISEEGFEVVGQASSGPEGIELARELAPDVVIMDLNMPGMSGVEATRALAAQAPASRVVVLTVSGDESSVTEAVLAGACGYLLKDADVDDILAAIRAAAAGESWISPRVAGALLERVRRGGGERSPASEPGLYRPRARGPAADRPGQGEHGDRLRALHEPEDGEEPRLEHPREAAAAEPDPGGGLRRAARA